MPILADVYSLLDLLLIFCCNNVLCKLSVPHGPISRPHLLLLGFFVSKAVSQKKKYFFSIEEESYSWVVARPNVRPLLRPLLQNEKRGR